MNSQALCPGCFEREPFPERDECPECGYSAEQDRSPLALPVHTELRGRYQIGKVLGEPGGFGVTYLGFDQRLELRVAIKEYVPRELAGRGSDGKSVVPYSSGDEEEFEYGLERFLGEAKALAQFDHANIVSVRDFFEANGTAYLVMDYYEGKTLKQYLSEQPEGRMDPDNAKEIMLRVLDGLKEVHAEGYLHRDIKPSNIYLTQEGRPILIDFGAARLALGEKSRSLSVVMTPGYAPYEQYRRDGDQGPYTDVYGCGATLYRMVTGKKPPPATDRVVDDTLEAPHEVNSEVSDGLSQAITDAVATGNKERTSSAAILLEQLQEGLQRLSSEARDTPATVAGEQTAGGKSTGKRDEKEMFKKTSTDARESSSGDLEERELLDPDEHVIFETESTSDGKAKKTGIVATNKNLYIRGKYWNLSKDFWGYERIKEPNNLKKRRVPLSWIQDIEVIGKPVGILERLGLIPFLATTIPLGYLFVMKSFQISMEQLHNKGAEEGTSILIGLLTAFAVFMLGLKLVIVTQKWYENELFESGLKIKTISSIMYVRINTCEENIYKLAKKLKKEVQK